MSESEGSTLIEECRASGMSINRKRQSAPHISITEYHEIIPTKAL